jgi:hypothetical protein
VLPHLAPLNEVVVPIALGDLLLLVVRLARSPSFLRGRLVSLEDHLLRERCLRRHKMGTLQLKSKGWAG